MKLMASQCHQELFPLESLHNTHITKTYVHLTKEYNPQLNLSASHAMHLTIAKKNSPYFCIHKKNLNYTIIQFIKEPETKYL
jgi:hypothetical protein